MKVNDIKEFLNIHVVVVLLTGLEDDVVYKNVTHSDNQSE